MLDSFFTRRWPWLKQIGEVYSELDGPPLDYAEYREPRVEETPEPRKWCPTCEPDYNSLDNLWIMCYCSAHWPDTDGTVSPPFSDDPYLIEAGGEYNRNACQIIHRAK